MLPKPEILKGEVREFVDLDYNLIMLYLGHADVQDYEFNFELRDFYSQAFKPEMIVEYFEGWSQGVNVENNPNGCFTNILTEYDIFLYGEFCIMKGNVELNFPASPSTLSQFITNCIQAGIKLTWKE